MKLLLAFMPVLCWAQGTIVPALQQTQVAPGGTFTVTLAKAGGGPVPAALEFVVTTSPVTAIVSVTGAPGAAGITASKTVDCTSLLAGALKCLLYGINQNILADGPAVILTATVANNVQQNVNITVTTSAPLGAGLTGTAIPLTVNPSVALSVSVKSKCDVNGDGPINASDVALVVNQAQNRAAHTAAADLNGDGAWNVLDVQIVSLTAAGGSCSVDAP